MAVMPEIVVKIDCAGLCATCRHWGSDYSQDDIYLLDVRECTRVVQFWDATEWGEDEGGDWVRRPTAQYHDRLAFAKDGSDFRACLLTKAEFGCVQWEAKPQ